jgi:hypothetical protein
VSDAVRRGRDGDHDRVGDGWEDATDATGACATTGGGVLPVGATAGVGTGAAVFVAA